MTACWQETGEDFPLKIKEFLFGAAIKGLGGIGGALLKTGISAATNATSTVATKAIESRGDWDAFADSMGSFDTWSGVIASSAGSLVTNSLGSINSFDGNQNALNGRTFNTTAIEKLNSLAGGLATSAMNYGLTGEATFNVLNISDFGVGSSSGLLEVSIGNNGVKGRIGTGGTDISTGTIRSAYAGLKEADRVIDWKYGNEEKRSTLNAVNMLGYTDISDNILLSKEIWNRTKSVEYGDTGSDYGNYTQGETKIRLSKDLLGKGNEAGAKLATVISHEGTHTYGNRIEGVAHP